MPTVTKKFPYTKAGTAAAKAFAKKHGAKYTEKSDDAYDKKHGIKEGSKKDIALDAKRGIKEDKGMGIIMRIRKATGGGY